MAADSGAERAADGFWERCGMRLSRREWRVVEYLCLSEPYTKAGDPFQFDFGYRVGE